MEVFNGLRIVSVHGGHSQMSCRVTTVCFVPGLVANLNHLPALGRKQAHNQHIHPNHSSLPFCLDRDRDGEQHLISCEGTECPSVICTVHPLGSTTGLDGEGSLPLPYDAHCTSAKRLCKIKQFGVNYVVYVGWGEKRAKYEFVKTP